MDVTGVRQATKGSPDRFIGDVWVTVISAPPSLVRVNTVRFAPGARNAWHTHLFGQTLHVVEGLGVVQARGEAAVLIHPGETVWSPPGEWHWHGATPEHFMTHLAIWQGLAEGEAGEESTWADAVDEDAYRLAVAQAGVPPIP